MVPTAVLPVAAQESVVVEGVVRDALTEAPLPGARLRFEGIRGGVLAGDYGSFRFAEVPGESVLLLVEQYGYESLWLSFDASALEGPLLVELTPRPVMLDGLEVVSERLATAKEQLDLRQKAVAVQSRAFDQQRLFRSASPNMGLFFLQEGQLQSVPCGRRSFASFCVWRRGRVIEPVVYIDEAPMIGGFEMLATYRPWELYRVEVYSQGQEIRAYTHNFMERMARRTEHLVPIGVGR